MDTRSCVWAFVLVCLTFASSAHAQSPAVTLAPTGTLRAAFLGDNPVQGRVDPQTGAATGPVPDLVRELANRLGLPARIIPAANAAPLIPAVNGARAASR